MAVVGAIVAVGLGTYTVINAENQKKKSRQAIKDFKRQELINPFADLQINTTREEMARDAQLSANATSVDALQRGGTRAVISGVPRLSESNVLLQNSILASIDDKVEKRDFAIARAEQRNQEIIERREEQALQGLGQQYQTARQDSATGTSNIVSGGLALVSAISANSTPQVETIDPQVETVNPQVETVNPQMNFRNDGNNRLGRYNYVKPSIFTETNPNIYHPFSGQNPFTSFTDPLFLNE